MTCSQCGEASRGVCALVAGKHVRTPPGFVRRHKLAKKGQWLPDGRACGGVLIVSDGVLSLSTVSGGGRTNTLSFLHRGGLTRVPAKSKSLVATALQPAVVCRIDETVIQDAIKARPEVASKLNEKYLDEMRRLRTRSFLLGIPTARDRLAAFLFFQTQDVRGGQAAPCMLRMPFTRYDIADYLLLTAETVSRSFTELAGEGMLVAETPRKIRMQREHPAWAEISKEYFAIA